uniref:Uncharacterized protein n=1 Tax=Rhizophora mucronata TaxID=61149 RepID=A0A2P2NW30_RHIMU
MAIICMESDEKITMLKVLVVEKPL